MGLLDWLLGRRKPTVRIAPTLTKEERPEPGPFEDRFLTLDKPRWFGQVSRSSNGRWMISWRDGGTAVPSSGAADNPKGAWLLYEAAVKRVARRGTMLRPTDGSVANNGTFVLAEMGFANTLDSVFHAFDADGKRLLKRKLRALIMTTAISKNGRYTLCTTANSPHGDGFTLFFFDLTTGEQVFATEPSAGWTKDYTIDEERVEVVAHFEKLGDFRYDRTGQFLDNAVLEDATLQRGSYSSVIRAAERILGAEPSEERARQVLAAIQRARREGGDNDPGWKATGLKVLGLAHESLGQTDAAIAAYQEALAINPKIGVKRRLTALQKRI